MSRRGRNRNNPPSSPKKSDDKMPKESGGGTVEGDAIQEELAHLRQIDKRFQSLRRNRDKEAETRVREEEALEKKRAKLKAQEDELSARAEAIVREDVATRLAKAETDLSLARSNRAAVEQQIEALNAELESTRKTELAKLQTELSRLKAKHDVLLADERMAYETWASEQRATVQQTEAKLLEAARTRAAEIESDGLGKAEHSLKAAHEAAQALRDQALADIIEQRNALMAQRLDVERQLAELDGRQAAAVRLEQDVVRREEELDQDLANLRDQREALLSRETRLGVHRVVELEQQIDELSARLSIASGRALSLATERDSLQTTLEEAGGAGASARAQEVDRLRTKVSELELQLSRSGDPERVQALQSEVDRLKVRAEAAQGIQARVEELQRVQSDVDQRFREVRQEADMAAGERDRLRADLAARTEELEAAHTEASRLMALEQDVTRLRNEGDWKEQEIHRLNDLLQVRQKAGERAKEKHYGPLATLDAREDELLADQRIPLDAVSSPRSLEALVKKLQARMHHHRENETDTGRRYREDDIRALLGTLAGSRMIVLKGLSGTGKTSLPMYAARAMGAAVARIPVQSGWRDRMDLLGTYNAFTEEFRPTAFTEAVYTANLPRFKERPFFIILDECNLSRVEYYFADLMSELQDAKEMHTVRLMERTPGDDWPEHLKDGHTLQIPPNVWFFLTANEDESTFELADKTFDRSMVMQMDQVAPPLDIKPQALKPVALSGLHKALRAASQPLSKKTAEWLDALRSELSRPDGLRLSLGNRFPAQAEAFVGVFTKAGGDEATALDLLVSTKVLRKLERERDPSRRKEFEDVKAVLGLAPGKLPRSEAMMDRVISRLS